jgi:hypothetical protein
MKQIAVIVLAFFLCVGLAQAHAAQVTLAWNAGGCPPGTSCQTTGYQVLRCQGAGCTPLDLPGATVLETVLTYTDTAVVPSTLYRYGVVALNQTLRSGVSNIIDVTTLTPLPPTPIGLVGTAQ